MDELPADTDPTITISYYEAEAVRINRWINVGFLGLVKAIEEKDGQLSTYEQKLIDWYTSCIEVIKAQDDAVNKEREPKRPWWRF